MSRQRCFPRSHQQLVIKGLSELQVMFHFLVVLNGFSSHKAVQLLFEPTRCQHLQPCYRRAAQPSFVLCEETASFLCLLVFNSPAAIFIWCPLILAPGQTVDRPSLFTLSVKSQFYDGHRIACLLSLPAGWELACFILFPAQKLFPILINFIALFWTFSHSKRIGTFFWDRTRTAQII